MERLKRFWRCTGLTFKLGCFGSIRAIFIAALVVFCFGVWVGSCYTRRSAYVHARQKYEQSLKACDPHGKPCDCNEIISDPDNEPGETEEIN